MAGGPENGTTSSNATNAGAKANAADDGTKLRDNDFEQQDFEQQAQQSQVGIVGEFLEFLKTNKKWWLTPIVIVIVLLTLFGILGQSVIAPFIYPLF